MGCPNCGAPDGNVGNEGVFCEQIDDSSYKLLCPVCGWEERVSTKESTKKKSGISVRLFADPKHYDGEAARDWVKANMYQAVHEAERAIEHAKWSEEFKKRTSEENKPSEVVSE